MKSQEQTTRHRSTGSGPRLSVLLSSLLILGSSTAFANDSYQLMMLFTPTHSMLKAEARGRIMIYDGLDIETVNRAMNEQFDRIDNMMFVQIHHPQDDGEQTVEDDGC